MAFACTALTSSTSMVMGFDVAMDMDWVVTLASPSNPTAQITLVQATGSAEPRMANGKKQK
jgi:hypothetical protein